MRAVQGFGLIPNFGRGGAPAPTDTPAESPKCLLSHFKWPNGLHGDKIHRRRSENGMMNPLSEL